VTREDANLIHSREVRAHGATEKGGVAAQAMSLAAKNETAWMDEGKDMIAVRQEQDHGRQEEG
jgi:hypothetical protein